MTAKPISDYTKTEALSINNSSMINDFDTPDFIYIDLGLVRDFQFGTIFTFLHDHPETADKKFKYLMSRWQLRQKGHFDFLDNYFPTLGITTHQINERLADPKYSDAIFRASPITFYPNVIKANQTVNINHSQVSEKFKKIKISQHQYVKNYDRVMFCINTWPLVLSKENQDLTAAFFRDNYLVDVTIISVNPEKLPLEIFKVADHLHLRYPYLFNKNPEILKELGTKTYINKKIFAAPMFDIENLNEYPDKRIEGELEFLFAYMNVLVTFKWIPNNVFCIRPDLFVPKKKEK